MNALHFEMLLVYKIFRAFKLITGRCPPSFLEQERGLSKTLFAQPVLSLLLPLSVVTQLSHLRSDVSPLQSSGDNVVLQIDVGLWRSLSNSPGLH